MEEQVTMKEPKRVTMKDPNKVKAGKRLAEYNRKKREELKVQKREEQKSEVSQYYGIGAVLVVGVISGLGYYIYQGKRGEVNVANNDIIPPQCPQNNKFKME